VGDLCAVRLERWYDDCDILLGLLLDVRKPAHSSMRKSRMSLLVLSGSSEQLLCQQGVD
jgi:hypothetical protein